MEGIPYNIPSVHLVNIKNQHILTAVFLLQFSGKTAYPEMSAHRKMKVGVQDYPTSPFSSLFHNPNSKGKQICEGKQRPYC